MNEEEKLSENETSVVETETPSKQKMDPKTKRNTAIIGTIGGLILVGTIVTAVVGHFANRFSSPRITTPVLVWDGQKPGTYDENRVFLTNTDVFSIAKNDDTYAVNGVNLTDDAAYLVMPGAYQDEGNQTYPFTQIPDGEGNIVAPLANNLKGLYFPTLYTSIGNYAFANMPRLEEVAFGSGTGVQKLGEGSLSNNPYLKNITFSENLHTIGKEAFKKDISLEEVSLLNTNLNVLGEGAFQECLALSEIHLPSTLNSLPANLFDGCILLLNVYYHSTMAAFQNLPKDETWNTNSGITSVICTDGVITL